ncbi:FERM domain-containing protein 8 [Cuculus canorus]|uniref:FERM domain-containing protein 8 n=1 Tax=Cuculus canorus TaxID=55661 RepID=UPI0023AAA085|nr:FERM domain-containing protein 8 [Cuculus canorus]
MDGEGEGEGAPPGAAVLLFLPGGEALPLPPEPPPGPTAAELLRRLQGALSLPPRALGALALWMSSDSLEVQLQPRHRPLRLARQWPELLLRFSCASPADIAREEPCLQLRRNVFFPKSEELEVSEEALLQLLWEDARALVAAGRCPTAQPEALQLGALALRLRLGPFCPTEHTARGLRPLVPEVLPPPLPRRWGALLFGPRAPPPEQELLTAFARTPGPETPGALLARTFLRRCHALPAYGCAFFPGAIERPGGLLGRGGLRPVSVAVGLEGVTVIDPRERQVLLSLTYAELCWELVGAVGQEDGAVGQEDSAVGQEEPPQLWLEFDGDHDGAPVSRLLRIFSPQAPLMSALIECCIALAPPTAPEAPPTAPEACPEAPPNAELSPPTAPEAPPTSGAPSRRRRLQRLPTLDFVREGQELRRVKPPRRSASFFGRGGAAGLEQG